MTGNAPQSRRVPWYVPGLAVLGLLVSVPLAAIVGHGRYTLFLVAGLPSLALFVARLGAAPADRAANPPASGASSLLIAMTALAIGLAIVIVGSYFRLFWAIAVLGIAFVAGTWKHRSEHSVRGGLAMVGVFVAIYGILATLVRILIL